MPRRTLFLAVAAAAVVAADAACNVFMSLEQCASDADCPSGATCDPDGRFCLRTVPTGSDATPPPPPPPQPMTDGGSEAEAAASPCDKSAPFANPHPVAGFESLPISSARLIGPETTAIFSAVAPDGGCVAESCNQFYFAHRDDLDAAFSDASLVANVNCTGVSQYWPTETSDLLVLFFESARQVDGGCTDPPGSISRIWSATRPNPSVDFGVPTIQSTFANVTDYESSPYLHPLGKTMYFTSQARGTKGGLDVYVAHLQDGFVTEVDPVDAVNTIHEENMPLVTYDDLSLYFGRVNDAGTGRDIWVSKRSTPTDAWPLPTMVSELSNTGSDDYPSWISDDECRFYFVTNRNWSNFAQYRLFVAERPRTSP